MTLHPAIMNLNDLAALGQYLREIREGQKLSKETVVERLRLRMIYLNALESGDWSTLPGLAYGRGYLRRYAELLGLPQEDVMAVCDRLQGKVNTRLNYFETSTGNEQPSRRSLWLAVAGILLVAAGWYASTREDIPLIPLEDTLTPPTTVASEPPSEVTPSPYPAAAQECMKQVQVVRDPCYTDDRMIRLLDDWKNQLYLPSNYLMIQSSNHP